MAVYSKVLLSASSNGRQIMVANWTQPGTTLHTALSGTLQTDEVWLYATNAFGSAVNLNIFWGGTNAADVITFPVPAQSGRSLLIDGKLIQNGLAITATTSQSGTNAVMIDGFVNRIT